MTKKTETNPLNEGVEKFTAFVAEASKSNQANLEALTTSAQILAKGTQEAATAGAAYSKAAFEAATEATKALTGAKSFQEVVEIQADYAKSSIATWMSEVNKISELMSATYKDAAKPVSESMTAFSAKLQQAAQQLYRYTKPKKPAPKERAFLYLYYQSLESVTRAQT